MACARGRERAGLHTQPPDPAVLAQLLKQAGLASVGNGAQALVLTQARPGMPCAPCPSGAVNPEHVRLWQPADSSCSARLAGATASGRRDHRVKGSRAADMLHRKAQSVTQFTAMALLLARHGRQFIRGARHASRSVAGSPRRKPRDGAGIGRALAVLARGLDRIGDPASPTRGCCATALLHPIQHPGKAPPW
jgi:hypothetical protein